MYRKLTLLIAIGLCLCTSARAQISLRDSTDRQPIAFAHIFDEHGEIVGTTDIDGQLPTDLTGSEFSFQHISYQPKSVPAEELQDGSEILMAPLVYRLNDAVITAAQGDYILLRTFIRGYMIIDSHPDLYTEAYVDYVINRKKDTMKRVEYNMRRFTNRMFVDENGEGTSYPLMSFVEPPTPKDQPLIESLKQEKWTYDPNQSTSYLTMGDVQGGVICIDTVNHLVRTQYDRIKSNHPKSFNLIKLKIRFEKFLQIETCRQEEYTSYIDLVSHQDYVKMFCKSRKDSVERKFELINELYVLDRSFVTKEEARQIIATQSSELTPLTTEQKAMVPPMSPAFKKVIEEEMVEVKK